MACTTILKSILVFFFEKHVDVSRALTSIDNRAMT